MKNILFTFLICANVISLFAQDFSLAPKLITGSTSNTGSNDMICQITNNSTDASDSMYSWNVIKYNPPTAWALTFCDPDNCYGAMNLGLTQNFKLKKSMSGQLKATYTFNNTGGRDTMKMIVQSLKKSTNKDTITFVVNAWMTGINEVSRASDINCYPNPVNDILYFKYPVNGSLNIDIYNILGTKVKSFIHDGKTTQVNVSDLNNGVYFVRFKDGANVYSKTFSKSE